MTKIVKNVLLMYKKSAYSIYFLERTEPLSRKQDEFVQEEIHRFKNAHNDHHASLTCIRDILNKHQISFSECTRGQEMDYSQFDLILTVGGDGTFLEAAKYIKNQLILGINSAPAFSVGKFCSANKDNFEGFLEGILNKTYTIRQYERLKIMMNNRRAAHDALNDILICHKNPAVMCRYYISANGIKEEQRSSGIWVSTPIGSTGAMRSAGGKIMDPVSRELQYKPRELYKWRNQPYQLEGGILTEDQSLEIVSMMRQGVLYMDGAHTHVDFPYGTKITLSRSPNPIKCVEVK